MRILLPAMIVGIVAIFAYMGFLAVIRDEVVAFVRINFGQTAAEIAPMILLAPSIAFFLTPLVLAERRAKVYSLICPECSAELNQSTARVLATRCCSKCRKQIVAGGRIRKDEVFDRFTQMKWRRYLVFWFWAWPALGLILLTCYRINPPSFDPCIHIVFVPGLVGTVATGWAFARTMDKRYLPQVGASTVALFVGVWVFWNAFW